MLGVVDGGTARAGAIARPDAGLAGHGLVLREWSEQDVAAMARLLDDPDIALHTPLPSPFTEVEAMGRLAWARRADRLLLAVTAGGGPLGEVSLLATGELGYMIGKPHRGQGLAARALLLLRDHAHDVVGMAVLWLLIEPDNAASVAVARRAGFRLSRPAAEVVVNKGRRCVLDEWHHVRPGPVDDAALTWRPLLAADLPMLAEWLREPQVARWWNHEHTEAAVQRDFGAGLRGEEPGEDLVVLLEGRPIGLLQRAVIHDCPDDVAEWEAVVAVPPGAVELDYLIGDATLRGRGLGSQLIAAAVRCTWSDHPDAPAVLVAVVAANVVSWRALEKAGLRRVAEGAMSPDNPVDDPLHYIYRIDRP